MRLKHLSDFGCDRTIGVVTAPDDVWEMELQKQPGIGEFREKQIANAPEMSEIFEGIQVTAQHAIYPEFGKAIVSHTTNTPSAYHVSTVNSANDALVSTPSNTKRSKLGDNNRGSHLGCVRYPAETPSIGLVHSVETILTKPIKLPTTMSGILRQ